MPLAVCATPIGNLDDVTLRVLDELRAADLVLCEDTRRTRILLDRHGIDARLSSYHRHNEAARTSQVIESLRAGERVALVSDAGLPGVNDPGARLIAAAVDAGIEVTVLPGASAVETALVVSGVAADRYQFVGYLPRRARELRALADELASWPGAVVAFESPRRLPASLRRAGRGASGPARGGVSRAHEAVRGGRARAARRALGAIRRAAARRDHARAGTGHRGARCALRRRRASCGRGAGGCGGSSSDRSGGCLEADRHTEERAVPRLPVTRQSICVAAPSGARYRRPHVRSSGNEIGHLHRHRSSLGACCRAVGLGMGVAR